MQEQIIWLAGKWHVCSGAALAYLGERGNQNATYEEPVHCNPYLGRGTPKRASREEERDIEVGKGGSDKGEARAGGGRHERGWQRSKSS